MKWTFQPSGFRRGAKCCMGARSAGMISYLPRLGAGNSQPIWPGERSLAAAAAPAAGLPAWYAEVIDQTKLQAVAGGAPPLHSESAFSIGATRHSAKYSRVFRFTFAVRKNRPIADKHRPTVNWTPQRTSSRKRHPRTARYVFLSTHVGFVTLVTRKLRCMASIRRRGCLNTGWVESLHVPTATPELDPARSSADSTPSGALAPRGARAGQPCPRVQGYVLGQGLSGGGASLLATMSVSFPCSCFAVSSSPGPALPSALPILLPRAVHPPPAVFPSCCFRPPGVGDELPGRRAQTTAAPGGRGHRAAEAAVARRERPATDRLSWRVPVGWRQWVPGALERENAAAVSAWRRALLSPPSFSCGTTFFSPRLHSVAAPPSSLPAFIQLRHHLFKAVPSVFPKVAAATAAEWTVAGPQLTDFWRPLVSSQTTRGTYLVSSAGEANCRPLQHRYRVRAAPRPPPHHLPGMPSVDHGAGVAAGRQRRGRPRPPPPGWVGVDKLQGRRLAPSCTAAAARSGRPAKWFEQRNNADILLAMKGQG